jgi:hypothetical protein
MFCGICFFITFVKTKLDFMTESERQIQMVIDLAKDNLANPPTKEEAIRSFQRAGIFDEKGKLTPPFKYLGHAIALNQGKDRY